MKPFFTAEDFKKQLNGQALELESAWQTLADITNEKLNKLIESWPVVYLNEIRDGETINYTNNRSTIFGHYCTHKARLALIEELPKEPCKHTPDMLYYGQWDGVRSAPCKHCGVELKATWSEKT